MTHLIVEGVDGVGKSTFAKRIASGESSFIYKHAGAPTESSWWDEYIKPILGLENTVLDRWCIGEMVWPKLFGRKSLFVDRADFDQCCLRLSELDAFAVVLFRHEADIEKTLSERGESDQIDLVLTAQEMFHDECEQIKHLKVFMVNSDVLQDNRLANALARL